MDKESLHKMLDLLSQSVLLSQLFWLTPLMFKKIYVTYNEQGKGPQRVPHNAFLYSQATQHLTFISTISTEESGRHSSTETSLSDWQLVLSRQITAKGMQTFWQTPINQGTMLSLSTCQPSSRDRATWLRSWSFPPLSIWNCLFSAGAKAALTSCSSYLRIRTDPPKCFLPSLSTAVIFSAFFCIYIIFHFTSGKCWLPTVTRNRLLLLMAVFKTCMSFYFVKVSIWYH